MPKISELPAAEPLTGAELVPIVQDGATVQTTAEALAALGGGEVLVATVAAFNLNTSTNQSLYVVPAGKKLLPTRVIFAEPTDTISFGSMTALNVRNADGSFSASVLTEEFPDTNGFVVVYVGKQGCVIAAGQALIGKAAVAHGSANTCTVYAFGVLLDA